MSRSVAQDYAKYRSPMHISELLAETFKVNPSPENLTAWVDAQPMPGQMELPLDCTCPWVPEKYWTTHYGAVDPATQQEWDPNCPQHQPSKFCDEVHSEFRVEYTGNLRVEHPVK